MRRSSSMAFLIMAGVLWCGCKAAKDRPRTGESVEIRPSGVSSNPVVHDSRPVVVAFGDSLTAGQGVDPAENYPARLQRKIDAAGLRYRVLNEGVSGDTTAQGLNRLGAVLQLHPALVIVELGANDGLRGLPVEETRKNLDEIVRAIRKDGGQVVLAGMQVPPNYGPEYTKSFGGIFPALSKKYNLALIPFFLEGVGGRGELNQEDGIHPTAEGYTIVTENVWRVVSPLLK